MAPSIYSSSSRKLCLNGHIYLFKLLKINFWRTTNQTEIDFIVTDGESQKAIEVKYNKTSRPKSFKTIAAYYPKMQTLLASKEDFLR